MTLWQSFNASVRTK